VGIPSDLADCALNKTSQLRLATAMQRWFSKTCLPQGRTWNSADMSVYGLPVGKQHWNYVAVMEAMPSEENHDKEAYDIWSYI
jgi:hypothetical protein